MRTKGEILSLVLENINNAPEDTKCALYHEYCFIEVMLDIRDTLLELVQALIDERQVRL